MLNDLKCLVFNKIELVKIQNAEMKSKTIKLKQGCDDCHWANWNLRKMLLRVESSIRYQSNWLKHFSNSFFCIQTSISFRRLRKSCVILFLISISEIYRKYNFSFKIWSTWIEDAMDWYKNDKIQFGYFWEYVSCWLSIAYIIGNNISSNNFDTRYLFTDPISSVRSNNRSSKIRYRLWIFCWNISSHYIFPNHSSIRVTGGFFSYRLKVLLSM